MSTQSSCFSSSSTDVLIQGCRDSVLIDQTSVDVSSVCKVSCSCCCISVTSQVTSYITFDSTSEQVSGQSVKSRIILQIGICSNVLESCSVLYECYESLSIGNVIGLNIKCCSLSCTTNEIASGQIVQIIVECRNVRRSSCQI